MNITLFGGTFDPPHLGHIQVIESVLNQKLFDEVWLLPVFEHQKRFEKTKMSSWDDRLSMLKIMSNRHISSTAIQQKNRVRICEFEKSSGKKSFTHLALRELSKQYPQHKFPWLMGSDQLSSLHLWKCDLHEACFPDCADEFDYYVYPRAGFAMNLPYNNLKIVENVKPVEISSTDIRNRVRLGESIADLVDPEVEKYIMDRDLYMST